MTLDFRSSRHLDERLDPFKEMSDRGRAWLTKREALDWGGERLLLRTERVGFEATVLFVRAPVPCGADSLSAIWLYSLHQPMSAFRAKAYKLDKRHYVRF